MRELPPNIRDGREIFPTFCTLQESLTLLAQAVVEILIFSCLCLLLLMYTTMHCLIPHEMSFYRCIHLFKRQCYEGREKRERQIIHLTGSLATRPELSHHKARNFFQVSHLGAGPENLVNLLLFCMPLVGNLSKVRQQVL